MASVSFKLDDKGQGNFSLSEANAELGKMVVGLYSTDLTVYHTQVIPEAEGKGYAKQLLDAMVSYAREHNLHVIPLCPYVLSQFRRHPDQYADIWLRQPA